MIEDRELLQAIQQLSPVERAALNARILGIDSQLARYVLRGLRARLKFIARGGQMPEEKAGSTQDAIGSAIGSIVDAGSNNAKTVDSTKVEQAADRRSSGAPIPPPTIPQNIRPGGGKKR
jgi:hypothetical protein